MLVEREKILKAKKKLGDKSARIISDILFIKEYDERNMKGLCPFHDEDTPSFIYNSKTYNFHCFGCGRNVDIIDACIHQGFTYAQSAQKLFEMSGINHSFGEVGVRTKHSYRYPKPEYAGKNELVYKYLGARQISPKVADYLNIKQDNSGNMLFQYYDLNDVLTMVKVRPSRKVNKGENKTWCLPGFDTTPLLFNLNKLNVETPLLITSGELDCAAAIEAGYQNACSIPLGDQNTQWVGECWDFLEQFDEIIIAYDNDESGEKFAKEIVPRLGSWRCKIVNLPNVAENNEGQKVHIKDLNECLYILGKEKLFDLIVHAQDTPVPSVVDFSDIEEKDFSDIDGVEFGIEELDKELMRLFYGSFTVVSGVPGSGKTSFLYQIICNAIDNNQNAWLFSRELPDWMSKNWLLYLMAGNRHLNKYKNKNGSVYWSVRPDARKAINKYYKERLVIYRDDYPNDIESLKTSMIDSARKYGCKLFIIDNMTTVDLQANDSNKYEKQTEFVNWLIQFSMKYNVCTILVNHPRKLQEGDSSNVGIYDLSGSANIANLAHRAIGLKRVSPKEKNGELSWDGKGWKKRPCKYDVVVHVIKDRMRGRANLDCGLFYDEKSRRFFSNPEEYDKKYAWDKNTYTDILDYPIIDEEEEVIGKIARDSK